MPRIRQNAERYAQEDFQREIRQRQGYYNLMSIRSLAQAVDIPHSTLNPKLKEPDKLAVSDLRKLIQTLHPDPAIVLALLGYTQKEITQFQKSS